MATCYAIDIALQIAYGYKYQLDKL